MVDILGYRRKIGLIVPSLNTVVLPDAFQASLTGVTSHVSDILVHDVALSVSQGFAGLAALDASVLASAMERMSTRSVHSTALLLDDDFFGAPYQGAAQALSQQYALSNLVTPADALRSALERTAIFKRVGLLTPYSDADAMRAAQRIEAMGCQVIRRESLAVASQGACASVTFVALRKHFERLLDHDIDGVIQLGHNLPLGRLVNNLEEDFGKPVLAINHVCLWKMLRGLGIEDVVPGLGRLLLDF